MGQQEGHHANPQAEEDERDQPLPDEKDEGMLGAAPGERRSQ
jgi:hypothetical protein